MARKFDPEYFFIPDEVKLTEINETLYQAQATIDYLRAERGRALSQARGFERELEALRRTLRKAF